MKKKISKSELVTNQTEQDYAEQDGGVIRRQRSLLQCQVSVLESEIAEYSKRIADARRVKSNCEAQIAGFSRTIRRRQLT